MPVQEATRMGRPPLPDEERRDKPLRIRMTDDERALVDEAAQQAGVPTSQWARDVLERTARRQVGQRQVPKR